MRYRNVAELPAEWQKPETATDIAGQAHEWICRFWLQVNDTLFELAYPCEGEIELRRLTNQARQFLDGRLCQPGGREKRVHQRDVRWYACRRAGVVLTTQVPNGGAGAEGRHQDDAFPELYGRRELRTCSISFLTCCRSMNSRYTEANLMYATSSRSRRRSITISPISPLGISTRPDRRGSASMSSTIARNRSGEMSRFSVAFFRPVNSFCGSKSSRRPSFFVT